MLRRNGDGSVRCSPSSIINTPHRFNLMQRSNFIKRHHQSHYSNNNNNADTLTTTTCSKQQLLLTRLRPLSSSHASALLFWYYSCCCWSCRLSAVDGVVVNVLPSMNRVDIICTGHVFAARGDPFELATPTPTPTSKPKPTSMSAIDLIVADIAHISDSSALPGTSTTTYRVRIVMAWQSCCLHLHLAVRSSTHDMQLW